VTNYYETKDEGLVSADHRKTIILAVLTGDPSESDAAVGPVLDAVKAANGRDGFQVLTVGGGSLNKEITAIFKNDLKRSEVLGFPAALVVLVIVFGALAAAGVPLVLSILTIFVAMGISGVASRLSQGDLS
jgi:RND superfamily putative drug exporter